MGPGPKSLSGRRSQCILHSAHIIVYSQIKLRFDGSWHHWSSAMTTNVKAFARMTVRRGLFLRVPYYSASSAAVMLMGWSCCSAGRRQASAFTTQEGFAGCTVVSQEACNAWMRCRWRRRSEGLRRMRPSVWRRGGVQADLERWGGGGANAVGGLEAVDGSRMRPPVWRRRRARSSSIIDGGGVQVESGHGMLSTWVMLVIIFSPKNYTLGLISLRRYMKSYYSYFLSSKRYCKMVIIYKI
jgi:hypothetical protein